MFENNEISDCAYERGLAYLKLESEKENDSIVLGLINAVTKVFSQIRLFRPVQPAYFTIAMCRDTVVKPIENYSLLLLNQQQNFHSEPPVSSADALPAEWNPCKSIIQHFAEAISAHDSFDTPSQMFRILFFQTTK
jgi:hypothetical protein